MPRRGENIRKRTDGRWEGRYICERDLTGKAKYRSVYAQSYSEVKRMLIAINRDDKKCKTRMMNPIKTFGEAASQWLAVCELNLKHSTVVKYSSLLRLHILPTFAKASLSTICDDNVSKFLITKSKSLSSSSINSILSVIKEIMKYSKKQGWIDRSCIDVSLPRPTNRTTKPLSSDEVFRLICVLKEDLTLVNLGFFLCLYTGIRIGELCALKWENIDLDNKLLHITSTLQRIKNPNMCDSRKTILLISEPKSKSSIRNIPLPTQIVEVLSLYKTNADSYLLSGNQKPVEPKTMQNKFKKIAIKANISYLTPHVLRHTFATRCIELGFDVKALSEILGHSRIEITLNRYVHSSEEHKRKQMSFLFANCGQNSGAEIF